MTDQTLSNLDLAVKEVDKYGDKKVLYKGKEYFMEGILIARDDLYYVLMPTVAVDHVCLLSFVGNLDSHGVEVLNGPGRR